MCQFNVPMFLRFEEADFQCAIGRVEFLQKFLHFCKQWAGFYKITS